MDTNHQTGIYIASPTTSILKSIYRQKNYRTKVNDQHIKVGIARDSFAARKKSYMANFDNQVEFIPVAVIGSEAIEDAERMVLESLKSAFDRVGRSREWFDTSDRERVIELIRQSLSSAGLQLRFIV